MLAQVVEAEVAEALAAHGHLTTDDSRRCLVRHGHMPERTVQTGICPVAVRQPRGRDRGGAGGERIRFSSTLLPPAEIGAAQGQGGPQEIWMAEGHADAEKAFHRFLAKYEAKYDKAAACLAKDREALLALYDFPAEHWKHIRAGNPIESTFATLRHRTTRTKGCLSHDTSMIMVFKMIQTAQGLWRRLDGQNHLPKLITGVKFADGIEAGHRDAA